MKLIFIMAINIYQKIFSSILKNVLGASNFCRFSPTCSEYAKQAILKHGALKGSYMSFVKILNCQPFKTLG